MKQCLICKEYLEDSALKCGKCGATQPKSSVTLPSRPARFALQVIPRKWFIGSPTHALLFDDRDMHELVIEKENQTARAAGALLIGQRGMDALDLHKHRTGWKKIKDLPMSELAATFRLERSIPYSTLKWLGLKNEAGALVLVLASRNGHFRMYYTGSAMAAPPDEEVVSGLKSILGSSLVSADGVEIPKDKLDD